MLDVTDNQYDNGSVGDSDLTRIIQHVSSSLVGAADNRVTLNLYDYRDRLIAAKIGALLDSSGNPNPAGETDSAHRLVTYLNLDNLGEVPGTYVYAGDAVSLGDFSSWSDTGTHPGLLRAWSRQWFDDMGRVYQSAVVSIDPTSGISSKKRGRESFVACCGRSCRARPSPVTFQGKNARKDLRPLISSGEVLGAIGRDLEPIGIALALQGLVDAALGKYLGRHITQLAGAVGALGASLAADKAALASGEQVLGNGVSDLADTNATIAQAEASLPSATD